MKKNSIEIIKYVYMLILLHPCLLYFILLKGYLLELHTILCNPNVYNYLYIAKHLKRRNLKYISITTLYYSNYISLFQKLKVNVTDMAC